VYTAAIEAGAKPTDTIVDGPVTFPTPNGPYTPHNYEPNFGGTMSLISAFAESKNIPALKLADRVGIRKVIEVAHRFGITSNIPAFLPIAIGAADITLAEQVGAYSVFPNDGIRIAPHYIRKVTQADGIPLDEKMPEVTEVISVDTARSMMTLLKAVVQFGTGAAASSLKHPLGGKTGTTNDFTDAWFIGFSPSVTCGTWIGYDNRQPLGKGEQGARAALPMWMEFMKVAIADKPDEFFPKDGAPKKVLALPVTDGVTTDETPKATPEEADPDAPESDAAPKPVGAAPAAAPVVAPTVNGVPTAPAVPAGVAPRSSVTRPLGAAPRDEPRAVPLTAPPSRTGVASPPPQ
jgi:penicillin-binding protein 1A